MSDITIGQLPTKTQLLDADMVVIDDGAQSYKMYYAQFKNLFRQAFQELFVDAAGDTMTGALVMDGVKVVHRQGAQDYPVLDTRDIPAGGAMGNPDYAAGVSIDSGYITPEPGFIRCRIRCWQGSGVLFFDGLEVWAVSSGGGQNDDARDSGPIPVGQGVTVTATGSILNFYFYPYQDN